MVRIGIPRALLYYEYYPLWRTFFEALGAEVVVSPPTTQAMLSAGSSRVVVDTCLPVKAFLGHVMSLVGKCDYIFIPAVCSVTPRVYNCSKFLALPDMSRAVIPRLPPILDIEVNVNTGQRRLYQAIYRLGRHFTWNPLKVRRAAWAAWQAHLDYQRLMASQGLTPPQAIDPLSGEAETSAGADAPPQALRGANIAIIGHPYLLYDEHISHRLIRRLKGAGNRVMTPEMLTGEELKAATERLVGGAYWTYEHEVVGAGGHYLDGEADGVIGIMIFGCGPDSLMMDVVRRWAAKRGNTPFMSLTLEEHTAEGGLLTRLEAFLDMIRRRKRKVAVC
ncbi:MAG: acyl-CoA dehydratase activase-related protein [Chloroflexota bacterium]